MPFDFTTIIGVPVRHPQIRRLLELCEEQPQASERYSELGGRHYLQFPRSGFSLLLTGDDVVDTVHIYARPNGEHAAFFDELPFALNAETTQAEARELFGPPTVSGGPIAPIPPAEISVYWDRWDYEHHTFHLEYPETRNSIRLITIGTPSELDGDRCGNA